MAELLFLGAESTEQNEYLADYEQIGAYLFPLRTNVKTGYYKNLRWKLPENNSKDHDQLMLWQSGSERVVTHNTALEEIGSTSVQGCQWGVNCGLSSLVIVDVDVKDGKLGLDSLAALEAEFGAIPRDCIVTSPSGGIHIYLRGLTCSKNGWRDGIDIKSHGGMVMGAGCFTPSGQYKVTTGSLRNIPQAPMWLLEDPELDLDLKYDRQDDGSYVKKGADKGLDLPRNSVVSNQPLFATSTVNYSTTQAEAEEIWAALQHIPSSTHDNEMRVMFALKSHVQPESYAWSLFTKWSAGSKYSDDHQRQWRDAVAGGINIETLYHLASQCGWTGFVPVDPAFQAMCSTLRSGSVGMDEVVEAGAGDVVTISHRSVFDFKRTAPDDHSVLLGNDRFLERGGCVVLSAGTGVGKSSLIMQSSLMWAVGRPSLGVPCNGPLKILLIQAENGEGDLEQARSSVVDTMMANGSYSAADILMARENFQVLAVDGPDGELLPINMYSGKMITDVIKGMATGFDLVIMDNLFSYAGCGVSEQAEMTQFLRGMINPVISSMGLGLIMIHHANKLLEVVDLDVIYKSLATSSQKGSGSGDIANWARATIEIAATEVEGHYVLLSGKRGKRIGWRDATGRAVAYKMVRHSDSGICWHEVDDVAMVEVKEAIDHARPKKTARVVVNWEQQREAAFDEIRRRGVMKLNCVYDFMAKMNGKTARMNSENLVLKQYLDEYDMQYIYIPMNKPKGITTNYHLVGVQKSINDAEVAIRKGEQLEL